MKNQIRSFYKLLGLFAIPAFSHDGYANTGNICTYSLYASGSYLSKCGEYTLGINWLKKVKYTDIQNKEDDSIFDYSELTGDYFEDIYDYSDTNNHNMENFRNFFAGTGTIKFKPKYDKYPPIKKQGEVDIVSIEDGIVSINIDEYPGLIKAKNDLLSKYCTEHGTNGRVKALFNSDCTKCPDNSTTVQSTINYNEELTHLDWNVKTIADCSISSLATDATGTYYYAEEDSDEQISCKYNSTTYGDPLPDETCTPDQTAGYLEAIMVGGSCKITKCDKNYTLNSTNTKCEPNSTQTTTTTDPDSGETTNNP